MLNAITIPYSGYFSCTIINVVLYRWKVWQSLNLVDWSQPVKTKILVDFGRQSSHAPNLTPAHSLCMLEIIMRGLVDGRKHFHVLSINSMKLELVVESCI